MDDCIFCKISRGEAPATLIYEDDDIIAFRPLQLVSQGHTLVVPRKHYENIFDIDESILKKLVVVAKSLSSQLKKDNRSTGINLLHASGKDAQQSVFHFHLHIVPRYKNDGLDLWLRERL